MESIVLWFSFHHPQDRRERVILKGFPWNFCNFEAILQKEKTSHITKLYRQFPGNYLKILICRMILIVQQMFHCWEHSEILLWNYSNFSFVALHQNNDKSFYNMVIVNLGYLLNNSLLSKEILCIAFIYSRL